MNNVTKDDKAYLEIRVMRVICYALMGAIGGVLATAWIAMIEFDVIYPAIAMGGLTGFAVGIHNEGVFTS